MSEFIHVINKIKAHKNFQWLTPSQKEAFKALKKALQKPEVVNLCGPVGAGKTFLCWILADELGYRYFPHRSRLEVTTSLNVSGVIIDNDLPNRESHRRLLVLLRMKNIHRAVVVTREVVQDYTCYVRLKITPMDIEKARENLLRMGVIRTQKASNLWELVNKVLSIRTEEV